MDSQKYWRRRTIEREKKWHELTDKELRELKKYYVAASKDLEKEIGLLYAKFGKDNALSISEARKLIRGDEFKEWRMTLQEYVKRAQGDPKILRELNTLAMRRRVSRLEALHARTLMELMDLGSRLQDTTDNQLYKAYLDTYYGSLYDFHKTIGLNTPPAAVDRPRVESVLQTTWSGKNYSSRIWTNTRKLAGEVKSTMLQAIHRGYSIQRLSKNLSERMGVAYKNAERLVLTELNAVENRASAAAMKEADFENYQYCAAMDRRTCARCGELDGEIFPLSAMNQGENAPPLHPRCRCTIVATFDSPGKRGKTSGERAARDYGNNPKTKSFADVVNELGGSDTSRVGKVNTAFGMSEGGTFDLPKAGGEVKGRRTRVPADMTYKDWKAVYIDKSKTFDAWQKEMEVKYAAMPPTREQLRGREIIDKLSSGAPLTSIKPNDKVATGALNDENDPDGKRRNAHAKVFYEEWRNSKKEFIVRRLAQNSGMSEKAISKIFDHVFIKEHDLDDGHHRFPPDYYMAESFRRISEGKNIQPHDLILLKHEWLELELMNRYDYDYDTAHDITERKYNYTLALRDWYRKRGIPWSG